MGLPEVIVVPDVFEVAAQGRRIQCSPSGDRIASIPLGGPQARPSNGTWDIKVDGAFIGQVPAEADETEQTIREAALKLLEELER